MGQQDQVCVTSAPFLSRRWPSTPSRSGPLRLSLRRVCDAQFDPQDVFKICADYEV